MLRFQWNALRPGQRVNLHDPASPEMALVAGTVVMFETHPGRRTVNGVGIRITDHDGTSRVLWPPHVTVHLDPDESSASTTTPPRVARSTEPCWRCDQIADRLPRSRQCGRCRETFPGDPTLARDVDVGWWACPPCTERLLGPAALAKPTWPARGAAATTTR